jgi:hypothetical protein
MATQRNPARGTSAAGDAADQELVNVLRSTVHAKVLASLTDVVGKAVDEAVQLGIVEASRVPGEDPVATAVSLSGHTTEITRPKAGGMCAAVWDELDRVRAGSNNVPTLGDVRKMAKRKHWNANNARIEYYRWRAFNGITVRPAKVQAEQRAPVHMVRVPSYTGPDRRAARPEARN